MRKKIAAFILTFLILVNLTSEVFATNSNDVNQNKFNEISKEIKNLDEEISKYDDEIYNLKLKVKDNEALVNNIENEINYTNLKIKDLEIEIEESEKILSDRLRELYKDGSYSGLNVFIYVLQSDSFSDLFSRINNAKTLISMDNKLIDEINIKVDTLNKSILSLQDKKVEIDSLNEEIKTSLITVEEKQKKIVSSRAKLSKEREDIRNLIATNEENLVMHQISIIYSTSPTKAQLQEAIVNLDGILPQITTTSVINKTKEAIAKAKDLIALLGQTTDTENNESNSNVGTGSFKATYTMEATAYSGHGITAMGTVPVRNPNGLSTVAVDPKVIPLGSKVFIPNYGYAMAADTGGAIKGMKIDLYMNSREECYTFGRKQITVHLVALPGEW